MYRPIVILLAIAVFVGAGMVLRTLALRPQPPLASAVERLPLDEVALADGLAQALRIRTISHAQDAPIDDAEFAAFHALLAQRFPRTFARLDVERIGAWSLLLHWRGEGDAAKPALLAAHMDVVPVEPGSETRWTHPAFAGVVADGYVWGRGALDDKSSLLAQLEAVERLLAQGYTPARSIYFAYGHDEEIGGANGAARIAQTLRDRGVRLAFTLDEGSAITRGVVPGIDKPVAAIMAGEKGYVSLRLTARAPGGHSSMPPEDSAIVRLAQAIERLAARPPPPRLTPPVEAMLVRLAPELPFGARLAIANRELLSPLLLRQLGRSPVTAALTRTTQAFTLVHAGVKDNVIPTEAYALVNYRLLPGTSIADVQAHVRSVIADERIELSVEAGFGNEAPPPSDPDAPEFALIARTVNEVFPEALVLSGIILATTDNRHYTDLRDQAYYFSPFVYTLADGARIHGTDERIGIGAYADMVRFYVRLLQNVGDDG
ncbi:M20/M25/M40 family metallo-hydrolase [Sinimarinibacterium thermocellulolyticum]|uniref:M20/M25/M40 family metallo-hydrolase n=1 Tax=Sinimarinibacterium thermocellulolyticum TaxID=3170016 RepID=A0ABV2AC56_9GAMM